MSFEEWKRAVTPKEQKERDQGNRNRQLAHQYSIVESFVDALLHSDGPIEDWERETLELLVASNSWRQWEAKKRLERTALRA